MDLKHIVIKNFRNIETIKLDFDTDTKLFIFHGANGVGKTNILEALHFSLLGKTHRNLKRNDLIRYGQVGSNITLHVATENSGFATVKVTISDTGKEHSINEKSNLSRNQLVSQFPIISFFPDELEAMRGSPKSRRQMIDRAMVYELGFLDIWRKYNHLLKGRNSLLRTFKKNGDMQLLQAITKQLADSGEKLTQLRKQYFSSLQIYLLDIFKSLLPTYQNFSFDFKPGYQQGNLYEQLINNIDKEIIVGRTLQGPHLADIYFYIENNTSKELASQGETRAMFLAFKLAVRKRIIEVLNEKPLLLLDDLCSELGEALLEKLFKEIGLDSQVLITTVAINSIPKQYIEKSKIINLPL